jgi:hypothetical protein
MLAVLPSLVAYAPIAPKGVTRASAPVMMAKSESIPFLDQPPALDGSMAGDIGFDPLLLSNVVPLQWAREAELKHARICMLATAGWVSVDLGFRVPLAPDVGSLQAHDAAVERGPMMLLFVVLATIEVAAGIPKVFQLLNDPDAAPGGDYKFDPLGFSDSKNIKELQEKELANGRLAMMAFSGIVTQSVLTGGGWPYTYNGVADLVPPVACSLAPVAGGCVTGV